MFSYDILVVHKKFSRKHFLFLYLSLRRTYLPAYGGYDGSRREKVCPAKRVTPLF